jgi:hypothetical protein
MAVAARVQLTKVTTFASPDAKEVVLNPVYSNDLGSPNFSFSKYTPSGEIRLYITNTDAHSFFEYGKTYDVVFTETATAS